MKIIYKAINKLTRKIYIGATIKTLESRIKDHLQKARLKTGGEFQEAIRTYGPEAFEWVQIDTADSNNELAEKEREYVIKFNSKEDGYNADRGGGVKKNIFMYDLETGVILSTFSSLSEAAEFVGLDNKTISKACLGEIKNCGGYSWSYTLSENFKPEEDKRKKKVFQFYLHGEFVRSYKSVSEASRFTGINSSSIAKCCRGEYKYAGEYYWEYED
ncbi:group I intron endonuclease [Salegentibacter sp. 24]|uniref:NUMOD1 domain-containing DNA-binding protein n=1 Tax=Salegentibacter sp. 24 TaxID=2183986 RepID=UPI00105DD88B|nr:NUMOD1 domain-containing DNA-binding protein [Salegentibacter sp. 24]TDN95318.1 group I intron endonuclease [Salegentibacter sp. 24]